MTFPSFSEFFRALHGYDPFPWQSRLAEIVYTEGWPEYLALPTSAGKTAALDIATWALGKESAEGRFPRQMPRRIALVVDRRIVVDDAFRRAQLIANKIASDKDGGVLASVREALQELGGEVPIHPTVLRGGIFRDERWARTPPQPTIMISTVDQVGSRILFRGYGINATSAPIHASLLANDTLILLDEAHLSAPFEETLQWIAHHRQQSENPLALPFAITRMSATPPAGITPFSANDEDRKHAVLKQRLGAHKRVRLVSVDSKKLVEAMAEEALAAAHPGSTVAVVVNRVGLAREILAKGEELAKKNKAKDALGAQFLLLTGRSRAIDRDAQLEHHRERLQSGRVRSESSMEPPLILVATQCVEAGADFDFDFLITQCAPIDALRQRFGRLDRMGVLDTADSGSIRGVIFIDEKALKETDDPIYGPALGETWKWMQGAASASGNLEVDFGIDHLPSMSETDLKKCLSPRLQAPVLQRAYVDLFSQTFPLPEPSPEPAPFLHGIQEADPDVQVVWRADLGQNQDNWGDVLTLCPPVIGETLPVRLSLFRLWLKENQPEAVLKELREATDADLEGVAAFKMSASAEKKASKAKKKTEGAADDEEDEGEEDDDALDLPEENHRAKGRRFLRWKGPDNSIVSSDPSDLRPGDTVVIPSSYGGCDQHGWNMTTKDPVEDRADDARRAAQRARVHRIHAALPRPANVPEAFWNKLISLDETPEEGLRRFIKALADETGFRLPAKWNAELHPSGRGVILSEPAEHLPTTFDDSGTDSSRAAGVDDEEIALDAHNMAVSKMAGEFARKTGLGEPIVTILETAGRYHDVGKADSRFQALLWGGNKLLALRAGKLLAKSKRLPSTAEQANRARILSGYPQDARHELLSTRLVESAVDRIAAPLSDRDLLLHLIASHHGRCRPFAPCVDDQHPVDVSIAVNGISLSANSDTKLERLDSGVSRRYFRLTRRYGWWGLAYLETILRLADHRVSEQSMKED